jgi:hypothetical protein
VNLGWEFERYIHSFRIDCFEKLPVGPAGGALLKMFFEAATCAGEGLEEF